MLGIATAGVVAMTMGFDRLVETQTFAPYLGILVLVVATRLVINTRYGLYSRGWRYASVADLTRITIAAALATAVAIPLVYVPQILALTDWTYGFPASFWVIELLLSVAVIGGLRFTIRAASEWDATAGLATARHGRPTLFYGAGRTGVMMARSAQRKARCGVVPVAFIDDDAVC